MMLERLRHWTVFPIVAALLLGLPLVGVLCTGQPIAKYAEFPPLTQYVEHAPFSWTVFVCLAIGIIAVVLPFDLHALRTRAPGPCGRGARQAAPRHPFPRWGWFGVGLVLAAWVLAWTRFAWFARLQVFTFSPLWYGYIIVVNALTQRRTGRCMLRNRPGYLLSLCLASAAFWWFFEYLNRFVQNWYYVGIEGLSPTQYFVFATLPFSTVLPAILGTYEFLDSFPRAGHGLDNFVKCPVARPKLTAAIVLGLSCAATACIGVRPDLLFPALWVSPLLIIVSIQALRGRETLFSPVARGDWRRLYLLGAAALICGFFWEMWNYHSVSKWIYAVPYVNRFKLFEMPVLGYAGYLPFGLECAVIADMLLPKRPSRGPDLQSGRENQVHVSRMNESKGRPFASTCSTLSQAGLQIRPTVRAILLRFGWLPVAVLLVHAIGVSVFNAYARWPAFDIPMHFLGGVAVAFFFTGTISVLHEHKLTQPLESYFQLPLVFGLTCAATVFWEFFEWTLARAFGSALQLGLDDTLLDMLLGIVGGCVFMAGQMASRFSRSPTERALTWTSN